MGDSLIQGIAMHQWLLAMPWNLTDPMTERERFVDTYLRRVYSMTELCSRFGISRKTGYKWLERFRSGGRTALADRSRAPRSCPHKTAPHIEELIIARREAHPNWGAPMIIDRLRLENPQLELPAYSTAGDILRRHNLIRPKAKRRKTIQPERVPLAVNAPNQVWALDYKGEFRLGNTQYCYPFTGTDQHSRFALVVRSHEVISGRAVMLDLEAVFYGFGLPEAIRTDNGVPFATHGLLGLSRLGAWWIKLGIDHQRIPPGQPWQNPRHERMHRTLKAATTRPPEYDHRAQQDRFDDFVDDFNYHRPHRGIGGIPPAKLYQKSQRPMPDRLPEPTYPGYFEVRRIDQSGKFKLRNLRFSLSQALQHEYIGLEQIDDEIWSIYYFDKLLARLDQRTNSIIP